MKRDFRVYDIISQTNLYLPIKGPSPVYRTSRTKEQMKNKAKTMKEQWTKENELNR